MPRKSASEQRKEELGIDQKVDWDFIILNHINKTLNEISKGTDAFVRCVDGFQAICEAIKDKKFEEEMHEIMANLEKESKKMRARQRDYSTPKSYLIYDAAYKRFMSIMRLLERRHMTPERVIIETL